MRKSIIFIRQNGFTLLEIITAVIIISILAGIALPKYMRTIEVGREKDAIYQLLAIKSMEGSLHAATGSYWPNNGSTWSTTSAINTALKLHIKENRIQYRCQSATDTFTCEAHYPSFAESSTSGWVISITESSGPQCSSGSCPTCTGSGCPHAS